MGLSEFGILGIVVAILFGTFKLKGKNVPVEKKKHEVDPMASFSNNNSDFDNKPVAKAEPEKA